MSSNDSSTNGTSRRVLRLSNMIFKDRQHRQYYLGHEIYIRICLLDEIFKYEILDINTIIDVHCKLKRYFFNYRELVTHGPGAGGWPGRKRRMPYDSTVDIMLRKYLEFFKIIKPNHNIKHFDNSEGAWGGLRIPFVLGDHINAVIYFGELYLDGILNNDYYYNFNVNLYMV
ncbi:hypothetical protein Cantr_00781 [Candida viswanathii]|uniref:Uncharacterized protein n=1 Tax=Candida viswanathii TaxID=5486 RepID=A0A367YG81_9ASCO|nr:hypothetical protein Cantr_00781 [Candida viswanathii]